MTLTANMAGDGSLNPGVSNRLPYLTNTSNLADFVAEFAALKFDPTYDLRVMMLGDSSHKYGPYFSDHIKADYSDGGAGMIEIENNPYSASGLIGDTTTGWTKRDLQTSYWGFWGSSITTSNNWATIRISRVSSPVNTFRLWYKGTDLDISTDFDADDTGDWFGVDITLTYDAVNKWMVGTVTNASQRVQTLLSSILTIGERYYHRIRMKSPTMTDAPLTGFAGVYYNNVTIISNPPLSTEWQTYEFYGDAIFGRAYIATINEGIGEQLHIDEILISSAMMDYKFSGAATTLALTGTGLNYQDVVWDGLEVYLYFENVYGDLEVYAIELYTGEGYVGDHFGQGGVRAKAASENLTNLKAFAAIRQHRLVVINLGANDMITDGSTPAQVKGYLDTIVSELDSVLTDAEFLVLSPNYALDIPGGVDDITYIEQVGALLDLLRLDSDVSTYNLGKMFGRFSKAVTNGYAVDGGNIIHPNIAGYEREGLFLFNAIDAL